MRFTHFLGQYQKVQVRTQFYGQCHRLKNKGLPSLSRQSHFYLTKTICADYSAFFSSLSSLAFVSA